MNEWTPLSQISQQIQGIVIQIVSSTSISIWIVSCGRWGLPPLKMTRCLDIVATISWLGGCKQLAAEAVDYGQLNTGTAVPQDMTGWLVKPNVCQTSWGQIWLISCRLLSRHVQPVICRNPGAGREKTLLNAIVADQSELSLLSSVWIVALVNGVWGHLLASPVCRQRCVSSRWSCDWRLTWDNKFKGVKSSVYWMSVLQFQVDRAGLTTCRNHHHRHYVQYDRLFAPSLTLPLRSKMVHLFTRDFYFVAMVKVA